MSFEILISSDNPLAQLRENPYALAIFAKDEDFELELSKEYFGEDFLVLVKRINGAISFVMTAAAQKVDLPFMRRLFQTYRSLVYKLAHGSYREMELVIIGGVIAPQVRAFVENYNQTYTHRCPIVIVRNEVWAKSD